MSLPKGYTLICNGALPSAVRPKTTIALLIKTPIKLQGRRVTTRKTRIA